MKSAREASAAGGGSGPRLTRPGTIRGLWWGGGILLVLVTLGDLVIHRHAPVPIAGTFGFASFFGFAACAAMVVVAKLLGWVLKRRDAYYEP
jgi:O-antigen ligase